MKQQNNDWIRIVQTDIKGNPVTVVLELSYTDETDNDVFVHTMLNDMYLDFRVYTGGNRDLAYRLIKDISIPTIKNMLLVEAINNDAL